LPDDGRGGRLRRGATRFGAEGDRGSVTAEFALVLPAVVLVLGVCLAAMQLSAQQVALQDAASSAARIVARGAGEAEAVRAAVALVPGSTLHTVPGGELACVELAVRRTVLALPGVDFAARSCSPRSPS
jgi:hypothetical protein